MGSETYRNTNDIDDHEYTRMRKAENSSYEYHGEEADKAVSEDADDGYPEVVEHGESGSVYDLKTDFIVLLPNEIIRIPQDSSSANRITRSVSNRIHRSGCLLDLHHHKYSQFLHTKSG